MEVQPVLCFKIEAGYDGIKLPAYQTAGAAGMDVCAAENLVLAPGETRLVATGFSMSLSEGYEAQLRPRSGLAIKNNITLMNAPGTIDYDFRGEVRVILTNLGREPFEVEKGDRIAQMVIAKVERPLIKVVDELDETARGEGGLGSTGGR